VAGTNRRRRDPVGSVLGILVFLLGVGLLVFTFGQARQIFDVPPKNALGLAKEKTLDYGQVGNSLVGLITRIVVLVVMGLVGSLIANRGILLYGHSLHPEPKEVPPPT
jgi:hypothetical protein